MSNDIVKPDLQTATTIVRAYVVQTMTLNQTRTTNGVRSNVFFTTRGAVTALSSLMISLNLVRDLTYEGHLHCEARAVRSLAAAVATVTGVPQSQHNNGSLAFVNGFNRRDVVEAAVEIYLAEIGYGPEITSTDLVVNTDRPVTDAEMSDIARAVGYAWSANLKTGEPMGDPWRITSTSFVMFGDLKMSSAGDLNAALVNFEDAVDHIVRRGSPVRVSDRAGYGTKGTRLVPPFESEDGPVTVTVKYDHMMNQ